MNVFSKLISTFNHPKTHEEIILDNAIKDKIPELNSNNIKIDRPKMDNITDTKKSPSAIINPYTFKFTEEKFCRILINPLEKEWFSVIYNILPEYNINTLERVAGFLAQTCHESSDYTTLQENLYYSAQGLRKTFPKYFGTPSIAAQYAKKPQMIANRVYANRMGNGPPESGEGFKFRARGIIQITGKYNYTLCSKYLFGDLRLVDNPDLILLEKSICVKSACWYWETKNLNKFCDRIDLDGMTKLINGGSNGLQNRKTRFTNYLNILKV